LGDSKLKDLNFIHAWIFNDLQPIDNPSAFYMNPLADLNCRIIEVDAMINTILNAQPKDGGGGGGGAPSKETVVETLIQQYKVKYDHIMIELDYPAVLKKKAPMYMEKAGMDGLLFPLNVFFKFEIERFINIVSIMKRTLDDIRSAIKGEIIMTADLSEAINAIFNNKIPFTWL